MAKANQWARDHGKTPFAIYQGAWNVMDRPIERDVLPMAREWGMAIAPWNVIAAGKLRTDEEEERRRKEEARVQHKLREMGVCVAGFRWIKQSSGYRCAGGSHFISNAALGIS